MHSCVSFVRVSLRGWMLVWLLVHCATINRSMAQCIAGKQNTRYSEGDIRVRGVANKANLTAGRMEICIGTQWHAVCTDGWDEENAMVVCRQLGFPTQGTQFCTDSCLGRSTLQKGVRDINCAGMEGRLIDCPRSDNNAKCLRYAGIACTQNLHPLTPDCSTCPTPWPTPRNFPTGAVTLATPTCPACPECLPSQHGPTAVTPCPCMINATNPRTNQRSPTTTPISMVAAGGEVQMVKMATCSYVAVGGGLGALAAIFMLILVGVVLGWVWYCHRTSRREKSNIQRQRDTSYSTQLQNPTYSSTCASTQQASAPYSTLGPRDTPLNCSPTSPMPTAETTFATYDIVEGDYHMLGAGGGEGDYHVLGESEGMTYDVPILNKPAIKPAAAAAAKITAEEYSTLQHQ